MLALPPASPDSAEGPPAAQYVEGRDRLGQHACRAEGDRADQRAEPEPRGDPGQHAERDPRLGNGLPGPADLGNLDQVVHQCDAVEPGIGGRGGDRGEPGRRIVAPREAGDLQHQAHRGRLGALPGGRGLAARRVGWLDHGLVGLGDDRPAFARDLVRGLGHPAQLAVERSGRHRNGSVTVPAPALARVRVEQHGDGRQLGQARELELAAPPDRIQAERIDHGVQAAP